MDSRITVIVPCWNYGMFLEECLDSLVNQTVKPAKIIIANDASTDDTLAIANRYKEHFPELFVILTQEKRVGTIKNENSAAELVDTPWMFFLDADDKVKKDYIEKVLKVIENNDEFLFVVYSDMVKFGNWEGVWNVAEFNRGALFTGNYINGHSVFKTNLFRQVGGLKDNGNFEDHQLWVDIMNLDERYYGKRIPEALVWYRRHDHGHRTDKNDIDKRQNYGQ